MKLRFSLRLVFIGLSLFCICLWWYWVRPRQLHEQQRSAGQALIHGRDRIYLESCFDETVKNSLVTVLGDSRLTHWDSVQWLACPDRETIVSFGRDNALLIWNRDDGSIRVGYYDVLCAAYARDVHRVIWADASRQLHITLLDKNPPHTESFALTLPKADSPRLMCTADGKYLIHSGHDVPTTIWKQESSQQIAAIARQDDAWPLLCTPDGHDLVFASSKRITEYELATGRLIATVQIPLSPDGSGAHVNAAAFSPDGATLYLGDAVGRVLVFDWTRKEFREEFLSNQNTITGLAAKADSLLVPNQAKPPCANRA